MLWVKINAEEKPEKTQVLAHKKLRDYQKKLILSKSLQK